MNILTPILTPRLKLVPCDFPLLEAIYQGNDALAAHLGVRVPEVWSEFGEPVFRYTERMLKMGPEQAGWWTWLAMHRADEVLAGVGGYKGPPNAVGMVEIGYETVVDYRGQGLATEFAQGLIDHAIAVAPVQRIWAHTLPDGLASIRVLEKCGLKRAAEVPDQEHGYILRWERIL